MRTLRRSVGRIGRLTVLWTLDSDGRTESVQLDDMVIPTDPSTPRSGPLDTGQAVTVEANDASTPGSPPRASPVKAHSRSRAYRRWRWRSGS